MINRRHIRLKVMQYLYSFQYIENEDTKVHKKYFNDCFSSVNSLFIMNFIFAFIMYNLSISLSFNEEQESSYKRGFLKLLILNFVLHYIYHN